MENIDINKIRKDIEDLKSKKQMLTLSLQKDLENMNKSKLDEFCSIGQKAYSLMNEWENAFAVLKEGFDNIGKIAVEEEAKNKKIAETSARYDEEITILEKLIPAVDINAKADAKGFCSNCGNAYNISEDMFCMKCGARL